MTQAATAGNIGRLGTMKSLQLLQFFAAQVQPLVVPGNEAARCSCELLLLSAKTRFLLNKSLTLTAIYPAHLDKTLEKTVLLKWLQR